MSVHVYTASSMRPAIDRQNNVLMLAHHRVTCLAVKIPKKDDVFFLPAIERTQNRLHTGLHPWPNIVVQC